MKQTVRQFGMGVTPLRVILLSVAYILVLFMGSANAATQFTSTFVRLDNLTATTQTEGRVCFQPTVTTAIKTVVLLFPTTNGTDYVVNATSTNWKLNSTGLDTGQTALANLPTNPTISGKTMTVTLSAAVTPVTTNTYCFNWTWTTNSGATPTLTTPSAGATETTKGTITTQDAGAVTINQTTYSEAPPITSNQVAVTATVPPSFTFSISGASDTFNNLATGSVNSTTTGRFTSVTTNAASGWIVWVKDLNNKSGKGALFSAGNNYSISTANAFGTSALFSTASENYGLGVYAVSSGTSGTCTGSFPTGTATAPNANYDGVTGGQNNWAGPLDPTGYRPMASCTGTSTAATASFKEYATITGATPEGNDYGDTLYLTGAGQF